MFKDDVIISDNSVISEDYITELLKNVTKSNEGASIEKVLNLFKNQNAVRYFKYNVNHYCDLHRLAISEIQDSSRYIEFLKNENTFQKVVEREEFYIHFFDILLLPLIEVCIKFSTEEEVFEETSKIIQRCVFSRNFKQFNNYLNEQLEKKKSSEKFNLCKALFKFITSLYSLEVCSFGFKLIFHSFTNTYNNFGLAYKMIIILMEIIGFDLKNEFNLSKINYKTCDMTLNKSLIITNELLDITTKLKLELEYKVNDVTFSDFIKKILKSLIALTVVPDNCCFQIVLKVAEINPLIIESLINEIIIYIMLNNNSKYRQNYEEVMIKLFEVFSKLHRIQNLISKMIPTLKSGIENPQLNETVYVFKGSLENHEINSEYNVDDILPKTVLKYFTNCIINLASWQVINLFKTLLYHLSKSVEELPELKGENGKLVYIEILSTLTCWVLLSVRMAEHTVATSTVEKFVGGLEELHTILGKFGVALLHKEHNHILMRGFLNLCYYWAEIYITLEYYSISNNVKMKRTTDSNLSSCNLTYLHSYLSDKEWCLISERITNFGGKPCKEIMQKLVIQKLRAILIFENNVSEDVTGPIIRSLSTDIHTNSTEIFTDRFIVNNVLDKLPSSVIMNLSETVVKDLFDGGVDMMQDSPVYDSQVITNGVLCVIFSKINKLLKQKRKHDEATVKKACCSKIISILPTEIFLNSNVEEFFEKATKILVFEGDGQAMDLKVHNDKIEKYLEILRKLPIIFCAESSQKLLLLLLFSLHRDINESNCSVALKKSCESLIVSIIQHNKFNLLDLFEARIFLEMLVKNFERSEDLFFYIAHNIFKNDTAIDGFQTGIEFIKENIQETKCLRFATVVLNLLSKIKKVKISTNSKELCFKYKSTICNKITKVISKKRPENRLIEPYAIVLKSVLAKDEDGLLSKLKSSLHDYVEFSISNLTDENLRGSLLLFTTILHHKTILTDFNDDFVLSIWNNLKAVTITNELMEDYSQVVTLIVSLIPNEQFTNIFEDLLRITEKSIDQGDNKKFYQHLKTWSCIISTNINSVKTNILREQLEFLLEKLILMMKCVEYKEDLFEEVIQFESSIIQTNHVPLTSAIVDFFLLSVTILMTKKTDHFIHVFNLSVLLMENLLKYRNPLIMDRLPPYLLQYRILLKELCTNSNSTLILEQNQVQKIADCAHKLEKLTKSLVECTKDMSRIAMYLIADILGQYELDTLYTNVKKHLNNCIYSLISLCDQHAVQYLMRVLSNASTEIFKIMYENYKKYYRFTGKV